MIITYHLKMFDMKNLIVFITCFFSCKIKVVYERNGIHKVSSGLHKNHFTSPSFIHHRIIKILI